MQMHCLFDLFALSVIMRLIAMKLLRLCFCAQILRLFSCFCVCMLQKDNALTNGELTRGMFISDWIY